MSKYFLTIWLLFFTLFSSFSFSEDNDFKIWILDFKKRAVQYGVSSEVVEDIMSEARYLPKVIEYDRYQPEFKKIHLHIKKKNKQEKLKKV